MVGYFEHYTDFPSDEVAARNVDVWLPPSYRSESARRFGVLYMHDGQNVFNPKIASKGVDWGVVPALLRLVVAGAAPEVIVVGVWCTERRWQEYLPERPFAARRGATLLKRLQAKIGNGPILSDAYLRFLVEELKPFIDGQYRTQPDAAHTTIMGSSMGGLASLYALCRYPTVFSGAGCLSTHWPAVEGVMLDYLEEALPRPGRHRIYFDYGTEALDAAYEPHQKRVDALMEKIGYTQGEDWLTRRFEGADHSEHAWRERVHIPLQFLLSAVGSDGFSHSDR